LPTKNSVVSDTAFSISSEEFYLRLIEPDQRKDPMTKLTNIDLQVLIQNARTGDSNSIGELLERYRPFLTNIAEWEIGPQLRKRIDAADVVQIAFMDASRDFEQFRGTTENEFSAWLQTIFRNRLKNVFRENRAAMRNPRKENTWYRKGGEMSTSVCWTDPAAQTSTPSQHLIQGERALRLAFEMQKLPEAQRDAVRMRHLEGMSLAAIAEQLERSPTATAGLIKRGVASLRKALQDQSLG
jgi:RNA polymerase sigma-70 factor (ECF subfamily)